MKRPWLIRYSDLEVESFDALGNKIEELSGEYTPELKAALEEAKHEKTRTEDV